MCSFCGMKWKLNQHVLFLHETGVTSRQMRNCLCNAEELQSSYKKIKKKNFANLSQMHSLPRKSISQWFVMREIEKSTCRFFLLQFVKLKAVIHSFQYSFFFPLLEMSRVISGCVINLNCFISSYRSSRLMYSAERHYAAVKLC